jgi:hypothetical protein
MYSELDVRNFRGISRLEVHGLSRINVIVGRNNSGKSSLLEAIFLLGGGADGRLPSTLGLLRGQPASPRTIDAVWRPLFYQLRLDQKIVLRGRWQNEPCVRWVEIGVTTASATTSLTTTTMAPQSSNGVGTAPSHSTIAGLTIGFHVPSGNYQAEASIDACSGQMRATSQPAGTGVRTTLLSARAFSSLTHDAQQFSRVVRDKLDASVLEAIRLIEPNIQRIEVLYEADSPTIYVDTGLDRLIPLAACGEGMVRLFSIAVELVAVRGGVLLIDEIDNGLHHSIMQPLWILLGSLCTKHDVQVVATTHNDEMIRSSFAAFEDRLGDLGLFRIDHRGDEHVAVQYDEESIHAVMNVGFEVRG